MGYRIRYGKQSAGGFRRFLMFWGLWFCVFLFVTRMWFPEGWAVCGALLEPLDAFCQELRECGNLQDIFHGF